MQSAQPHSKSVAHRTTESTVDEEEARAGDAANAQRTESQLRERDALFRTAFDDAPIGMALTTLDGQWVRVNRALCEMVGYSESELLATTFQAISYPDDIEPSMEFHRQVIAGERPCYQLEKRYVHRQGHTVWAAVSSALVRDDHGRPQHLLAHIQDVTERVRTERALRESEARYKHVVANAPGVVYQYVFRPDGSQAFTIVSEGTRELFGIAPEAILQDPAAIFGRIHPEDLPGLSASGAEAVAALAPWHWEGRIVLSSGEEKWVQVASRNERQPDGSVLADGLLMDVTERRRAAQQLEESEVRFRALIENASDPVSVLDETGTLRYVSPAHERVLGHTVDSLMGTSAFAYVHPDDVAAMVAKFRQLAAEPGAAAAVEFRFQHANGSWRTLAALGRNLLQHPAVRGIVVNATDVTERQGLEAQLRQAQKMEAVGRLAGGVAHDFNNLLSVIMSYSGMLLQELPVGDPIHRDMQEIQGAVERAAELTRQLLAFSRQQLLQPRRLDVNSHVLNVAKMLRRVIGEDIALETDLEQSTWPVDADPGQLEQVLMNLAVNARDAMPGGGTLRLSSANVTVDALQLRDRPGLVPGDYVSLGVEDTGVGIDAARLPQIFEPFYTTKEVGDGTGLGLATVYGIVKQSGGYIYVDSVPGRGSRFSVLMPRRGERAGEEGSDGARPAAAALPRGRETILVVEDEAPVRVVVRRMLERLGYTVREAADGAQALCFVEASAERIDLLLTDVIMPEMHGRALAERLMTSEPGIRVLYMSGYTDDDILRRGLTQPGTVLLQKPFTPEELARAVREVLDGQGASSR
jgi:two-component system cell cycle sensor histidine kinase/response regulator CckA